MAWNEAAKRLFGGEGSYGNGAAMRVAPVGLFYHDDPEQLRAGGAALQAYAVALAVKEDPSSRLDVSTFFEKLKDFTRNEVYKEKLEKVERLFGEADKRRVVRGLGNGVEAHNSVPTAIYCFLRSSRSFEEAVQCAISLGGDTDTIGAMTGAISGAYHGAEAIPESWKSQLERRDYIETLAGKLWRIKSEFFR